LVQIGLGRSHQSNKVILGQENRLLKIKYIYGPKLNGRLQWTYEVFTLENGGCSLATEHSLYQYQKDDRMDKRLLGNLNTGCQFYIGGFEIPGVNTVKN
jgi:hypothetical protein